MNGQCSGYLVSHDGYHLWMDAGTGTFARVQEHVQVEDIGAMLITHGHADHFLDIIPHFYARHYGRMGAPGLPFFSPEGFMDYAAMLVSEAGRDVMSEAYAMNHIRDGASFELGPFPIEAVEMTHIGVYSLGYRIRAGGHLLAFTGDTGPCENAIELARDADLFMCEATYQDDSELTYFHMSARQAAEHAAAAGVKRLVLTHITPDLDTGVSLEQAADAYDGPVDVATPTPCGKSGREPPRRARLRRPPPGHVRDRLPGVGRGLGPLLDGQDAGHLRGQPGRGGAALAAGSGSGLGHGRVLDAARGDERAVAARGQPRATRWPNPGDPAADRPLAPVRHGHACAWGSGRSPSIATSSRPTPGRGPRRSPAATSRWRSRSESSASTTPCATRWPRSRWHRGR